MSEENKILFLPKVSIVERAVLRLDRISRLNMGDYLCVASNGIPPSASNRFSVKVQCKFFYSFFAARKLTLDPFIKSKNVVVMLPSYPQILS